MGEEARVNTHKKFQAWLDKTYLDDKVMEEDWEALIDEDAQAQ